MQQPFRPGVFAIWLAAAACGGGTDYLGQSPEDAAADLAQVGCDYAFECGVYELDCDPMEITHHPASDYYDSHAACESQSAAAYRDIFTGCAAANLTDDEKDLLNDCLNANAGAGCRTEAELDELLEQACSGGNAAFDEVCERAFPVLEHCYACFDDPLDC